MAESKSKAKPKKKKVSKKIKAKTRENYMAALRGLSWEDTDEGFYSWIVVEADHNCTKQYKVFKVFREKWLGKKKNSKKSDVEQNEWNGKRAFYTNLCAYGCLI